MGLSNKLSCEAGSFSSHRNCHRFSQPEVLRLSLTTLEPWVAQSVSLPSCSQFICTHTWDHQLLPCRTTSLPLLSVWVNVSLSLCLLDFHTVWFSGSSGFLFSNLLLSFFWFSFWLLSSFWLCKEASCIYLHLHLSQKFRFLSNCCKSPKKVSSVFTREKKLPLSGLVQLRPVIQRSTIILNSIFSMIWHYLC